MKPRIFVSSTYYDLKYIRDDLNKFIGRYGFTPSLFENGGVTFEYGKELDVSCYKEIDNCNMLILIVGGRYGSKASEKGDIKKEREQYENTVVSVTQREFRTAREQGIPIYVFIEKNVFSEFQTYIKNKDTEFLSKILFAHVDSINVFKFIDEIMSMSIYVAQFEHFADIEIVLSDQWAGLFYEHLKELKNRKETSIQLNAINEMKDIVRKMEIMIDGIGHSQLSQEQINSITKEQSTVSLQTISEGIFSFIMEVFKNNPSDSDYEKYVDALLEGISTHSNSDDIIRYIMKNDPTDRRISIGYIPYKTTFIKNVVNDYLQHNDKGPLRSKIVNLFKQRAIPLPNY